MITGGIGLTAGVFTLFNSTECLNTEDGSVTMASPMKSKRLGHGMGIIAINGENRLAVFGGYDGTNFLDNVELYNTQTEKWETSDFKLSKAKSGFSFLTVKLGDILSKLQWLSN